MEAVGKHVIQLQPGLVELFLLLFADDLAFLSSTAMGLKNQLNHLNSMCEEHSLCINSEKSKIMVFRKDGFLGKCERWFQKLLIVIPILAKHLQLNLVFVKVLAP